MNIEIWKTRYIYLSSKKKTEEKYTLIYMFDNRVWNRLLNLCDHLINPVELVSWPLATIIYKVLLIFVPYSHVASY